MIYGYRLIYGLSFIFSEVFEKSSNSVDLSLGKRYHSFAFRGIAMGVNYKRLWKLLIDKDMTKADLRSATDIASSTLTKMSHNEYVSLDVLVRICCALDCELNEIVEIEHDK